MAPTESLEPSAGRAAARRRRPGGRPRRRGAARVAAVAAAAAVLAFAPDALACPRCATALEARAIARDDQPLTWLAVSAAPFAVMFGLAAWTSRIGRAGATTEEREDP